MSLDSLHFDNSFIHTLPGDQQTDNSRRQVYGSCYSYVAPTKVRQPKLIAFSPEAAELLDLNEQACLSNLFTEIFAGNSLLPDMEPFAMCYGGHQFGNWAGQLGDGRAINLGEIVNKKRERWMLQLKGAGPTPYSRRADGLAVLRSSIREFLCSEAMYHLGIPTTRALSLIATGEPVLRDMFYDGHPKNEPGAVVCRLSPSFTRFGNFEIFTSRKEIDILAQLVDHTIQTDFPHLAEPDEDTYLQWFSEICTRTAEMIVHWMRVGFVHGVMNTDNMSILGLTIDYGPYGWLEGYDPRWTPNTTDFTTLRYAFGNQPNVAMWNLTQLANSLLPILGSADEIQKILETSYRQEFITRWQDMMAAKLGLAQYIAQYDEALFSELLEILANTETDMTVFFRQLAAIHPDTITTEFSQLPEPLVMAYYRPEEINEEYLKRFSRWLLAYGHRIKTDASSRDDRVKKMNNTNPKYVLRNYLAGEAIELAENGDYSRIMELLDLLRNPYDEQPEKQHFYQKRPEWARHKPGCATLS
ncbi:YdiU family protein [Desulfopila sp. IMCC35008]|uniref:protein adenylyltransferase SelO n=1 Tax=Desulfopila sp. IMCC35008 TaxID=2653858 RepID=UPI0013D8B9D7|nr:YdiU family protein [Desulfopila sp. IMCC35008]